MMLNPRVVFATVMVVIAVVVAVGGVAYYLIRKYCTTCKIIQISFIQTLRNNLYPSTGDTWERSRPSGTGRCRRRPGAAPQSTTRKMAEQQHSSSNNSSNNNKKTAVEETERETGGVKSSRSYYEAGRLQVKQEDN